MNRERIFSPSFRRPILAAAVAGLVGGLVGCDDGGNRAAVDAQVEAASMRLTGGKPDDVINKLQPVASSSAATPAVVQAQQALGQVQMAKGALLMREVASLQTQASDIAFQISTKALAARSSLTSANTFRLLDPKESVTALNTLGTSARGDGNAASFDVADNAKLPTLAAAQQKKSQLEGDIAKTQGAIDSATAARNTALAQADKVAKDLEGQTGEPRVATAQQLADLRQQAAMSARAANEAASQLARLNADLAEQTALITQLQGAIDGFNGQATSLGEGWKAVQARADAQQALAKQLLTGDTDSVKSLTASLNKVMADLKAKREEAESAFKDAITSLGTAATRAGTVVTQINGYKSSSPNANEKLGWDKQLSAINADQINLDKAAAEKALADLYIQQAQLLVSLIGVSQSVETASEAVNAAPPELFNTNTLKKELDTVVKSADEQLGAVDESVEGAQLTNANANAFKPLKATAKIIALSDRASLGALAGSMGVAPEIAGKAGQYKKDLDAAVGSAREENIALPALPVSMVGVAPAKPVEKPAEEAKPTEDAKPADGAAPAGEAKPADGATPPADGEAKPAEGEVKPAEGVTPPAEGTTPPADGATPPADNATPPAAQ